jgi:hypothetical protein
MDDVKPMVPDYFFFAPPITAEHHEPAPLDTVEKALVPTWTTEPLPDRFERKSESSIEGGMTLAASYSEGSIDSLKGALRVRRERSHGVERGSTDDSEAPARTPTFRSSILSDLIASGEGDYGSFNRGTAGDSAAERIDFSRMTIGEIMRRQRLPRGDPNRLFAVGRYQIVPSTMRMAVSTLGIDSERTLTPGLQERIFADFLIDDKRPQVRAYVTGESDNIFAAQLALAREFASVADPRTGRSYYDGIGNNSASIGAGEAAQALRSMRHLYAANRAQGLDPSEAWVGAFQQEPGSGSAAMLGLRRGHRGEAVASLQRMLVDKGFSTRADMETGRGIFGPRTEAGLRAFQAAHGLVESGMVDVRTARALLRPEAMRDEPENEKTDADGVDPEKPAPEGPDPLPYGPLPIPGRRLDGSTGKKGHRRKPTP